MHRDKLSKNAKDRVRKGCKSAGVKLLRKVKMFIIRLGSVNLETHSLVEPYTRHRRMRVKCCTATTTRKSVAVELECPFRVAWNENA